jgi:ketosteroid isomerase-like protein
MAVEHDNAALIARLYAALGRGDGAAMGACYSDAARFDDPMFPGLNATEVRGMWAMLTAKSATPPKIEVSGITADDTNGSAHWVATYTFGDAKRLVRNEITAAFTFADGLIVTHVDSFDLMAWATQALGFKGTMLASLPFGRRLLQRSVRRQLDAFLATQ